MRLLGVRWGWRRRWRGRREERLGVGRMRLMDREVLLRKGVGGGNSLSRGRIKAAVRGHEA